MTINNLHAANRAVIDAFDAARDSLPEELAAALQAHRANEHRLAEKISAMYRNSGQGGAS